MKTEIGAAKIVSRRLVKPRLKVVYPQVAGWKNTIAQKMVNQDILEQVYRLIRDQGIADDYTKTATGSFEVKLNARKLLSVVLDNYTYAKGAAHGLTLQKSVTADLETGKQLGLEDLFLPDSGYRERISEWIRQEIKEKNIPLISPFKGIGKHPDFYLTETELVIYFQLYEYTPYAYGFPAFAIPYTTLREMIDPKGPLVRLVK